MPQHSPFRSCLLSRKRPKHLAHKFSTPFSSDAGERSRTPLDFSPFHHDSPSRYQSHHGTSRRKRQGPLGLSCVEPPQRVSGHLQSLSSSNSTGRAEPAHAL